MKYTNFDIIETIVVFSTEMPTNWINGILVSDIAKMTPEPLTKHSLCLPDIAIVSATLFATNTVDKVFVLAAPTFYNFEIRIFVIWF
jgi:hypothetical protein